MRFVGSGRFLSLFALIAVVGVGCGKRRPVADDGIGGAGGATGSGGQGAFAGSGGVAGGGGVPSSGAAGSAVGTGGAAGRGGATGGTTDPAGTGGAVGAVGGTVGTAGSGGASGGAVGTAGAPGAGGTAQAGGAGGGTGGATGAAGTGGGPSSAVCGNGLREPNERCDDGNTRGGDGCTPACAVEDGFVCGDGEAAACNRSCAGLTGTECRGDDCCASLRVPGGTITMRERVVGAGPIIFDERSVTVPSFRLDKYEVTVARFRAFMAQVAAWEAAGNPVEGAGAHPDVPASGFQRLWLTWPRIGGVTGLAPAIALMPTATSVSSPVYAAPGSDSLAVNWVEWHIAFAFCIWDGGRLPADVEWVYAGYRGEEQTRYAWGNAPTSAEMFATIPDPAVPYPYGGTNAFWKWVSIPVGSHPVSVGRFGHHDLMAGLWEYTRDTPNGIREDFIWLAGEDIPPTTFSGFEHRSRGGGWQDNGVPAYSHADGGGGIGWSTVGFRCARDLR